MDERGGRLPAPRDARVRFWEGVRAGLGLGEAVAAAGLNWPPQRWFAEAGGVKGNGPGPVSGRYLSLAEREEIAVGLAARKSLRQIARELGRPVSVDGEPGGGPQQLGRGVGYCPSLTMSMAASLGLSMFSQS